MNKTVYFDANKEVVSELADRMAKHHEDRVLVLAPISGSATVHAPSKTGKHKGHHRFKFEVWIPQDAIKGVEALIDFGIITLMTLPTDRIEEHLLSAGDDTNEPHS